MAAGAGGVIGVGVSGVAVAAFARLFAAFVLLVAFNRVDGLHFRHVPLELILAGAGGSGTLFLGFLGITSRHPFRLGRTGNRLSDV